MNVKVFLWLLLVTVALVACKGTRTQEQPGLESLYNEPPTCGLSEDMVVIELKDLQQKNDSWHATPVEFGDYYRLDSDWVYAEMSLPQDLWTTNKPGMESMERFFAWARVTRGIEEYRTGSIIISRLLTQEEKSTFLQITGTESGKISDCGGKTR